MTRKDIGLVIIGRNESIHLRNNLPKLVDLFAATVFVDSDSSDDSVAVATENGVEVLQLDLTRPFTAGRARNEGFEWLVKHNPQLEYVQFIDGDCELLSTFVKAAADHLDQHSHVAVVAGRRRERFPDKTIFNAACEVEWNTPHGEARACGGDFLIRTSVMNEVGGFNPALIAGEEPEMCVRIREAGYKIFRIDHDMTMHDANMNRIGQWWKRCERSGYAYITDFTLHGRPPEKLYVREVARILIFGSLTCFAVLATLFWDIKFILLLLVFPIQAFRSYLNFARPEHNEYQRRAYSLSCGFAYIPQFFGVMRFFWHRLRGKQSTIIEYK